MTDTWALKQSAYTEKHCKEEQSAELRTPASLTKLERTA